MKTIIALALGTALSAFSTAAQLVQSTIYTPRGGREGGYLAVPVPGTQPRERLEIGRGTGTPDTGYSVGVYGKSGERVGTIETRPWGGVAIYDKQGRRLN